MFATPVAGAAPTEPSDAVGCEAAVARAQAQTPDPTAALRRQTEARAAVAESWPALELRARSSYPDSVETMRGGLRLNLPPPGVRDALAGAARAEGGQAEAEVQQAALDGALAVRAAHLAVRVARARLAWAEEDAALASLRVSGVRKQAKAGMETEVSLAQEALDADRRADEVILARADLHQAEADLAGLTGGAVADEGDCLPPSPQQSQALAPPEHPLLADRRLALTRAAQAGEAERQAGGFALKTVDLEWDQSTASSGRVLLSVGLTLPSFADENAAGVADVAVARAALDESARQLTAEVIRLEAHQAAAARRSAALEARPPPAELAVLAEAQRLRPQAPETLALAALAAQRHRRRTEARFAWEATRIALAHARGR
jgi:hypothetical protein